jgi:phosphoribosyl 1,2-cyclic phosphate phosphodiesterase
MKGKAIFLGTGTSQGVPLIACNCHVCSSKDFRDKRLRSSLLLQINSLNYVIDTGPDFREQMLRLKIQDLESILFTHEHKDHIAGLDDVRAFNYKQQKPMKVYCTEHVEVAIQREFHYIFSAQSYPGIPKIDIQIINKEPFKLSDTINIIPILVYHHKMPVFGYRVGNFAYITDAKTIEQEERDKLKGLNTLVINALHQYPHISHFNLEEALEFIADIQPKKAFLTHISHQFGTYEEIKKLLPPHVEVSFDGMEIEFEC